MASFYELAKICKATYSSPINTKIYRINDVPLKEQKIVHGSFRRGFCRVFWNDTDVVVAFRGSREKVDWFISNFYCLPSRLKLPNPIEERIMVHRGFQQTLHYLDKTTGVPALNAIFSHMEKNQLFEKNIIITGHSLGGAAAILFATKLRSKMLKIKSNQISQICTFGSPAVGGDKFKSFYAELSDRTIRIVNGFDAVPFTPPIGFRHVGKEIWINEGGSINDFGWCKRLWAALKVFKLSRLARDHYMPGYIEGVKDLHGI